MTLRANVSRESAQLAMPFESRLAREFEAHRAAHPAVYRRLVDLALEAKARGWRRIGIAFLWERLRWEFGPHAKDVYGFGCNNDLRALYARALMQEIPELAGFFETRRQRSL